MDELQISGKRYISSRRVARENGYTQDYVGQLIRAGKVVGQKVGRAWYVDADSFSVYLGLSPSEQVAVSEPVVVAPVVVEDHLPPVSVVEEQNTEPVPEPEIKTEEAQKIKITVTEPELELEKAEPEPELEKKEAPAPLQTSGLRYYADDEPMLPRLAQHAAVPLSLGTAPAPTESVHSASAVRARSGGKNRALALAVIAVGVLVFSAAASSVISLNISVGEENTASTFYSIEW